MDYLSPFLGNIFVNKTSDQLPMIYFNINGYKIGFLLDTGSQISILHPTLGPIVKSRYQPTRKRNMPKICTALGESNTLINSLGILKVKLKNTLLSIDIFEANQVAKLNSSVLGMNFIHKYVKKLDLEGETFILKVGETEMTIPIFFSG